MKPRVNKQNIWIYVVVIILGIIGANQAQAAWTSKETARVKVLEVKVKELENLISQQSAKYEMKTIRFLATGGSSGTYRDICPGLENLEGGEAYSYIGRLAPSTDIFGRPNKDISGKEVTYAVYSCKATFWVPKL
jgi:hypothetical protein